MDKSVEKKSNIDKYIQLFKQFIKYKKHLVKIKKNKEIESINKKIQNEINRINFGEKNNNTPSNKNYLYIIKGSINIIENFWKKKCINKNKIIDKSSNAKDFNNINYRTYQTKFYENYFSIFNSLRIIDISDEFICHNRLRKNLTDIFRNRDYLSSIIKKILIKEKGKNQYNNIKKLAKKPLIISINHSDNKTCNINDLKKENMLNIKSCIIKINEKSKYQSNYLNYLKEFKNNIKSNNTKNKNKNPQRNENKKECIKQKSSKEFKNTKILKETKNKNNNENNINEIKEIKIINYIKNNQSNNNIYLIKKINENKNIDIIKKKNNDNKCVNFLKKKNNQIKDKFKKEDKIMPKHTIEIQKEKNINKFKEIKDRIKKYNKDIENKKLKSYKSFTFENRNKAVNFNYDNKNKNSVGRKQKREVEKIINIFRDESNKDSEKNFEVKDEQEIKTINSNNYNNSIKLNNNEKILEEINSNNEYINNNYSLDLQKSLNNNIDDNNHNLKEETFDSFNENFIYEEKNYYHYKKVKITKNQDKNNIYDKKIVQNPFSKYNNNKIDEIINLSKDTYEIKEINSNYCSNKEEIKNASLNENDKFKITEESKNNSSIEPIIIENIQIFKKIENNFDFLKNKIKTNIHKDKIGKESLDKKNNSEILNISLKDNILINKNEYFCLTDINKKDNINEMLTEKNNKIKLYLGLSLHHSKSHDLIILNTITNKQKYKTQLIN